MIKFSILLIVILFIFLINCSPEPEQWTGSEKIIDGVVFTKNTPDGLWQNSKKLIIDEIIAIGSDSESNDDLLVQPSDIQVDQDGNIYVGDRKDHSIKVYDNRGNLLNKIGGQGEGPGELRNPSTFCLVGDNRLAVISSGANISLFSRQGEFLRSFHFDIPARMLMDVAWNESTQQLLIASMIPPFIPVDDDPVTLFVYDQSGTLAYSFGAPVLFSETSAGKQFPIPCITNTPSKELLVAYEYPYRIEKYSAEGKLIQVISRDSEIFSKPEPVSLSAPVEFLMARSLIKSINSFPNGYFMLSILDQGADFAEVMTKDPRNPQMQYTIYYDLYDKKGRFLQSFQDENHGEIGFMVHIDSEGFAYSISLPDQLPQVRKLKISFAD